MHSPSNRTSHAGSFKSLTSLAFLALGLMGAAGCASEAAPSRSTAGAPRSEPEITAAPRPNPEGTGETMISKVDNATGGTIELSNGTKLEVPAGALPPGVDTLTFTSSPVAAPSEYVAASPVYVFGPDGTVFLKPVKVSFPLTLPVGETVGEMTILWSRAHAEGFDMVPTSITPVAGSSTDFIAVGAVMHFSEGFCGVKYTTDPHPSKDPYAK